MVGNNRKGVYLVKVSDPFYRQICLRSKGDRGNMERKESLLLSFRFQNSIMQMYENNFTSKVNSY
jgi:hypothetical protein